MLNTVKEAMYNFGGNAGDVARRVGNGSARTVRRLGKQSRRIARDVGPTRALVGLAITAVAIGGSIFLVRYLRARREESEELGEGGELEDLTGGRRSRARRKAMHVHAQR